MRILTAFLFFLLLPLGGCSIPRAVALNAMIHTEIPVPPNAKQKDLRVSSLLTRFDNPSAFICLEVPMSREEAIAWYADRLAKRGWSLTRGDQQGWQSPPATNPASATANEFHATRIRWQLGDIVLLREQLDAAIGTASESPNTCVATFTVSEDSLFDKPAQSFETVFLPPFGKADTDSRLMNFYLMIYIYAIF